MVAEHHGASWLIIDWGTTNFRAFAISSDGKEISRIEHKLGLLTVKQGEFAQKLEEVLSSWLGDYQHLPVFMAGMVGSQQGWHDVPYVNTPVKKRGILEHCHTFLLPWGAQASICPGVRHQHNYGQFDVMRGEEIQLIGAQSLLGKEDFHAVLPGTHSKYVKVERGAIASFSTYMTGEMFSVLSKHTILGKDLGTTNVPHNTEVFLKGVEESRVDSLTKQLFMARTHRLFNQIDKQHVLDYLSGLLIGHEVKSIIAEMISSRREQLNIIGSHQLSKKYEMALNSLGLISQVLDGESCFIEGMKELQREKVNEQVEVV